MHTKSAPAFALASMIGILIAIPAVAKDKPLTEAKPASMTHKSEAGFTTLSPREIFKRSISDSSGDIFFLTERYNFLLEPSSFDPKVFHASHVTSKVNGKSETTVIPAHPDMTHGYAWDYDLRVPIAFYDPSGQWFKRGIFSQLAVQQDIAPTLADVLGIAAPDRAEGRILAEARAKPTAKKPKLMILIVQDQMGWQYYDAHPTRLPYLRSLFRRGALFTNGQVAQVDVETAPGHAAIGTGAYPRGHTISANNRWQTGLWAPHAVYAAKFSEAAHSDEFPLQLGAATLADVWLQSQNNAPEVFSLCAAARASVSLGGHGSMFGQNKKTAVVYYEEKGDNAGTFTADPAHYRLPESVAGKSVMSYGERLLKNSGGTWFGNTLRGKDGTISASAIRATPAMVEFERDLVNAAASELKLGQHGVTDLLFVNFKSSDYCGHNYGYESDECAEVLDAIDNALADVITKLEKLTGGELVVAVTADHGAPPLPELTGGVRLDRAKLQADLNAKFSEQGSRIQVVPFIGASQLWLNRKELQRRGFTLSDVTAYLKDYEVPMTTPWNMLADQWKGKGKPAKVKFFRDVVSRDEL
ncbi:MAG: Alkaline phosphatase precursor [Pseudomonadota bacterium]